MLIQLLFLGASEIHVLHNRGVVLLPMDAEHTPMTTANPDTDDVMSDDFKWPI